MLSKTENKSDDKPSGQDSNKKNFNKKQSVHQTRGVKFEGRCDDLKGHVYDYGDGKTADQFVLTTKEIKNYVGRTFKHGGDIVDAIEAMAVPTKTEPADPVNPNDRIEVKKWERLYDAYHKWTMLTTENLKALKELVWGQCSQNMQQKIESLPNFDTINDGIALLVAIQNTSYNYHSQTYIFETVNEALYRLMTLRQNQLSPSQYYDQFTNCLAVYTHVGGSITPDPGPLAYMVAKNPTWVAGNLTADQLASVKQMAWANWFLLHADRTRYDDLITGIQNDFQAGDLHDTYPKTINEAYQRLTNYKAKNATIRSTNQSTGVTFTNVGGGGNGKAKKNKDHITCFNCQENGHYSNECTKPKTSGSTGTTHTTTNEEEEEEENAVALLNNGASSGEFDEMHASFHFMIGHSLTTESFHTIPSTWLLLDNQSTIDVFCNRALLSNIKTSDRSMSIHCNAGVKTTNQTGFFPGYGEVWYHPTGIANILSLYRVRQNGFSVSYDDQRNTFIIKKPNGGSHEFAQSEKGLYYLDTAAQKHASVFVNTVEINKSKYSQRDYLRAIEARKLLCKIGRPSQKTFLSILERNLIPNCPVTRRDAVTAFAIFGPDIGSLKGKTVRHSGVPVAPILNDLPWETMSQYRDVTLTADIFYVNSVMFFVTKSRHIHFSTVETVANREPDTIIKAFNNVRNIYLRRGFVISHLLADVEFEYLRGFLSSLAITLNAASADEHVPDIERHIRTIKERTRCIYNTLPFHKFPDRLTIEMVVASNFWLNSFPSDSGISDVLSPRAIVTGSSIDFHRHCQLEFGSYVQVHEESNHSMATRTVGALALRPTGNAQGGYYFFSLATGRVINRNRWTEVPMPAETITRIHLLSRRNPRGMIFSNRDRVPFILDDDFVDEDDDSTYVPDDATLDDAPAGVDDDDSDAGNNDDVNVNNPDPDDPEDDEYYEQVAIDMAIEEQRQAENVPENVNYDEGEEDNNNDLENNEDRNENVSVASSNNNGIEDVNDGDEDDDTNEDDINVTMDNKYGARVSTHGLRPRKPRDYGHLHTTLEHTVMTQYSVKKGLKIFGEAGVEAVVSELKQLHDRAVIEPVQASTLSREDKHKALAYLMFLKKKRTGKIKGRGCADGRKQREDLTKEEVSSPTVATESVMLSCTIDAHENRDVATVDVPGAFLQADMEDTVYMRIDGAMAELLIRLDPELYNKFVEIKNGKKVLYLLLKKALYGTLKAALLFWKLLSSKLQSWGFEINPYDPCVANKLINGKQCTILWHVDDLKISHVDPVEVTKIIALLSEAFGTEAPLTINRGLTHDYLGMTIDYSDKGKVKIDMKDYIKNILNELPVDMAGVAPTPAANHLFDVNDEAEKLNDDQKEFFHHVVAQLLFLCKRARPDIQTAIAFLCTRVQKPDTDDYKKLCRVIKYLRKTISMPLRLEADSLNIAKWWVDASYAVHPDMKSHTGGVFTLGKGAIYGTSTRQKINTKSSTEAELVGVAEVLPQILWTQYFLEAQGYTSENAIIYQDNKSSILLEKNGKASSSKRTRHINVRYYFVTDRISNGEIDIIYCPTKEMIADFFTKPLQGIAFTGFRDFIMNVASDVATDNIQNHRSVLENDGEEPEFDGEEPEFSRIKKSKSNDVVNTIHGYGNDDGFTIVTRRLRKNTNERKPMSKKGTTEGQPTNMSNKKVSKKVRGENRQNNRAKAHFI
jgi:hypothetical protein